MSAECDFSLVIPAFNEAGRILPTLLRVASFLGASGLSHEITVVDDGSTDETMAIGREFAATHPRVQVIGYTPNRGKGYAVKMGVLSSNGRVIAFSDADMPVQPEEYGRFFGAIERGNDLAIGSRYLPTARWDMSLGRRIAGHGFRLVVRLIAGKLVSDTQFGFKMFTARAAKDLFSSLTVDGFAFDAELIRIGRQRGYRIAELPVRGVNAPGSTVRPLHDAVEMLWQLMLIRFRSHAQPENELEPHRYPRSPFLRP